MVEEHTTDAAELEVRAEGAHDPVVDPRANLEPGEAAEDDPREGVGEPLEDDDEGRRELVELVQQEREEAGDAPNDR